MLESPSWSCPIAQRPSLPRRSLGTTCCRRYIRLDGIRRCSSAHSVLKTGDVGAVVQVYSEDAVEVEFVTASGRTQALVTLATASIRPVGSKDILAVRQLDAA